MRRLKMAEQSYTDDFATEFSFDDFLKLFANHFYRTTDEDVEEALGFLGFYEPDLVSCCETPQPYICKHDFVKYLTEEGARHKHITIHTFKTRSLTLIFFNR